MAIYGVTFSIQYVAWDTGNNVGKTGDVANHTLRWVKGGTSAAPTNTPAEVDATNLPGVYQVVLTAAECQTVFGTLGGKSSTGNTIIAPISVSFEHTPNVAPGASGGLPTVNASNQIAGIAGTKTTLDALNDITTTQVNTEVDNSMVTYGLDHLVSAAAIGTDIVDNSIIARMVSKSATADWDSFNNTTDSLEAIRDRGDAAWDTASGTFTADLTSIKGTAITETTAGRLAQSFSTLLDNADSAATLTLDNISTWTATDFNARILAYGLDHLVSAAVIGTDIVDNSIIAKMVSKSATADWDSFNNTTDSLEAISDDASGVNVTSIMGTALTETTAGNLANNFVTYYDNADALTSLTMDLIYDKLQLISVSSITVVSSVVDGVVEHIYQGANHTVAEGTQIDIPIDGTIHPLSSATEVRLELSAQAAAGSGDATSSFISSAIINPDVTGQIARFLPLAADTTTLALNATGYDSRPDVVSFHAYKYQVVAQTGTGGSAVCTVVAEGTVSVKAKFGSCT